MDAHNEAHSSRHSRDPNPEPTVAALEKSYIRHPDHHQIVFGLSEIIAKGGPAAEQIADELLGWLGRQIYDGPATDKAYSTLQWALHDMPDDQAGWLIQKLKAAGSDEEHPFRAGDAAKLLASVMSDSAAGKQLLYEQLNSPDRAIQASGAFYAGLQVDKIVASGKREAAEKAMSFYLPSILEAIGTIDGDLVFNDVQIMGAVRGWAESMPDETLAALLSQDFVNGVSRDAKSSSRATGAVMALVNIVSDAIPDMPERLAEKLCIGGYINMIAAESLAHLGEPASKAIFDKMRTMSDIQEVRLASKVMVAQGAEAFDYLLGRAETGDMADNVRALACIGLFGERLQLAQLGRQIEGIEKIGARFYGERLDAILARGAGSGDPLWSNQVEQIRILQKHLDPNG